MRSHGTGYACYQGERPPSGTCADCRQANTEKMAKYARTPGTYTFDRNHGIGVPGLARREYWATGYYGMTREKRNRLYNDQGGCCAICKEAFLDEDLQVDHDHKCCQRGSCGECVRGLLCRACNLLLGIIDDNPELLNSAVEYLSAHSGVLQAQGLE